MDQRIRVAYTLAQCWHRVPGGTASSILALAEELGRRSEVELVGVGPAGRTLPPPPWTPSCRVVRVPAPRQALYDIWQHTPFLSPERAVPGTDVLHVTAATVPSRPSTPMAVTVHDLFPLSNPEYFTPRGVRIMKRGIELARERADLVCCPSSDTLTSCVEAGFDPERLRLVPWGATPRPVHADDRRRVRDRYRLDRPFILWVGTIEPRKNLPTLLDAYRSAQPLVEDLVLVGQVGWHEQLDGHISGIGSRVRRLGFVPAEDLAALYAEARLFCFPSTREGFGLPALEAMAQGTPVIASAGTAVHEVVADNGVVVDATDVDAWTDALRTVLDDASLLDSLAERGRARAAEFTWERCADAMISVYRELVA